MFTKNYLTRNLKSLLIRADVVSVLPGIRADAMSPVHYCTWEKSSFIPERGSFCVSNKSNQNYVQLTTTQTTKKPLCKADNKRQIKSIKQIISQFKRLVKGKIADMYFKPKKRDFTLEDLTLIQKLVDKNKGDFPKSWAQFYKLTGTNPETFNN